ncbi:MAG: zinc ribbon domain-containing protein [Sulfuritalea sp.]|nr:zinc ribbon domain-containing protein [Sulfuritalea sp.]
MLATKCSFCQHENSPGSRFCAKCGSPMHLKICPNPQCGKVSDVTAEVCESCGQAFPKIALAPVRAEAPADSKQPATPPAPARAGKSRMPAWPLVMMAIVAGGLPLLWANRAQLPTPKTWQVDPDAQKTRAATPPAGSEQKPPAAAANVARLQRRHRSKRPRRATAIRAQRPTQEPPTIPGPRHVNRQTAKPPRRPQRSRARRLNRRVPAPKRSPHSALRSQAGRQ